MRPVDAERAFSYLLGELPEGEASQLDEAVLAEADTHELLAAWEAELFDAYLEQDLSAPRRARFEQRFLSTPDGRERLRRAQALRRRAPAVAPTAWWKRVLEGLRGPRVMAIGLAVAAVLALVVWPRAAPEARISLRPDSVRAAGDVRRLEVAASSAVVFELALDDAPAAASWAVTLSGPNGSSWKGASSRADAVAAEVKVDGVAWVSGRYRLVLTSAAETLAYDVDVLVR